jgi:hypothetical protein
VIYFANEKNRPYMKMHPSTNSTSCQPFSTDIGTFVIDDNGRGSLFCSTGSLDLVGADAAGRLVGILAKVMSTASSDLIGVQTVEDSDLLVMDYSTQYEGSTANAILSTNIGHYFKLCKSTGSTTYGTPALQAILGKYIDPSTVSATAASTSGFVFQMKDYSTQSRKIWAQLVRASSNVVVYN